MRKLLLAILILSVFTTSAQNVTIHGTIKNNLITEVTLFRPAKGLVYDYFKEGFITVPVKNGVFDISITVEDPEIVNLSCDDTSGKTVIARQLFLKKGYALAISFVGSEKDMTIVTSGKGANDNQDLAAMSYRSFDTFYKTKDTLPASVISYLIEHHKKDSLAIAAYIRKNKPSAEFVDAWKYQIKYQLLSDYYGYSENMKFSIREAYARNLSAWRGIQDELFSKVKLSDDKALQSPYYMRLVRNFILRKKERLWTESNENKIAFLTEWYGTDIAKGEKEFMEDMTNLLSQKIIDRNFTGKVKEYAYALLFESAVRSSLVTNMPSIYADFKEAYPKSKYNIRFEPEFAGMFGRTKNPLTDKMIFIKEGDKLNTWESVLAQVKGKTVLLDMWGTWCGPCREEMEKNGAEIKKYFKDKGLDYLYIANHDEGQEKKWKELIAYFNLEGYHILANAKLNKDIMDSIKGTGYPTYAIIHKDGSFELSTAGYPMDRQKLIRQIESALK